MVAESIYKYETRVACSQTGLHSCGGLAHKGLMYKMCKTIPIELKACIIMMKYRSKACIIMCLKEEPYNILLS